MAERVLVRAGAIFDPAVTDADALLIEGDRIAAVDRMEAFGAAPQEGARVVDLRPAALVPGFVDTHVHSTGSGLRSAPADMRTDSAEALLLRAADNGRRALAEGVTTMRDCGARNDVILAYELEGNELSDAHGGPVRLYVAPMYGYKSIKWLGGIELVKKVVPGYWEQRGYDVDAWVGRSNGRDDEAT